MLKAVLFDCDGVLVNSEAVCDRAQTMVLERHGLFYTPQEFMANFTGLDAAERLKMIGVDYQALHGGPLPDSVVTDLYQAYNDLLEKEMAITVGMAALIIRLKEAGVPFAVASNSHLGKLEIKLRKVGLYDLFAPHVYSRDHVAHAKPAPDMYEYAAARLGVDPADCVVVEDSGPGLTAGVAAGCHVIGFTVNYLYPSLAEPFLQAAGATETATTMERLAERIAALVGLPPEEFSPPGTVPLAPAP